MTFADFSAAVLENLGPDAQRSGTGTSGLEAFRLRAIVNAMIDMQRYIIPLRIDHSDTLTSADVTLEGRASTASLPAGCRPTEFWIRENPSVLVTGGTGEPNSPDGLIFYASAYTDGVATKYSAPNSTGLIELIFRLDDNGYWYYEIKPYGGFIAFQYYRGLDVDGTPVGVTFVPFGSPPGSLPVPTVTLNSEGPSCNRYKLEPYLWKDRHALICGGVCDGLYRYTISPNAKTYYIHPGLTAATSLNLIWTGIKTSWQDADELTDAWDNAVAEAVGEYVKWRIVRNYDKDSVARAERHHQDYMAKRLAVLRDAQEVEG